MKSNYEKPSEKKKRIKLENLKRVKKNQRLRNRLQPPKILGFTRFCTGKIKIQNFKRKSNNSI